MGCIDVPQSDKVQQSYGEFSPSWYKNSRKTTCALDRQLLMQRSGHVVITPLLLHTFRLDRVMQHPHQEFSSS